MIKNNLKLIFLISIICIFCKTPAHAQDIPQFAFPVACTLGTDCWTVNYVDTDTHEKSARDFTCANKTTEDHKGTDFAIRSRIEMEKGVNVLAAKDGKILRLRDGEDDVPKTDKEYQTIRNQNKDCGNGIIIDHGNGLQTYYCQLKQNSIKVKIGDAVKQGDIIAQIGQSGDAAFPHLHFTIIWEGGQIDPFTGELKEEGCGRFKDNMWEPDIAYEPYAIFDGGFADKVPDFNAIKAGQENPLTLSKNADTLVYWASFYHATQGDKITLKIIDPTEEIFAQKTQILENSRKEASYYYTGRKISNIPLLSGTYTGTITYEKTGHTPKTITHKIEIQ